MKNTSTRGRARRGLTLIEVLLVLAILVIIASVAIVAIGPRMEEAKRGKAKVLIGEFETALEAYRINIGSFPTTSQGLDALQNAPTDLPNPAKWAGPYLKKGVPADPWGQSFQYASPGSNNADAPDIWSLGADGQDGTADDVTNWSEE